jgi:hypothetical protein
LRALASIVDRTSVDNLWIIVDNLRRLSTEVRNSTFSVDNPYQLSWIIFADNQRLQVLSPLAHALGAGKVLWELEDLAFRALFPESYAAVEAWQVREEGK